MWNKDIEDWQVLKEGHDADAIAKQVTQMTRKEDMENLASKFDSLDEYNKHLEEGGKTSRETEVESFINKQLKVAEEKARELSNAGEGKSMIDDRNRPEATSSMDSGGDNVNEIDKEAMDKAIALFNDDDYTEL